MAQMTTADWLIVLFRLIAVGGVVIGFWPAVRRLFQATTEEARRTRLALAVLLISLLVTHLYSILFRLFDYQSVPVAVLVAFGAAVAGVAVAWAFWPWRTS